MSSFRAIGRGLRLFVAQPGFAWAAVVTLALAIGANTLIFSIANLLVVKPLPIANPDRLGWILATAPGGPPDRAGVSLPEYAAFRDEVPALTRLAAWRRDSATMRQANLTEPVTAQAVIGDLQALWGLSASHGRVLTAADERPGAPRVIVLSDNFWRNRFGASTDILGRDVLVDGQLHTVVGVLAPDIELGNLAEIDLWVPHREDPRLGPRDQRGWRPVGLLRDAATLEEAHTQVTGVVARIARDHPDSSRDWTARVGSTRAALGGANTWLVLALLSLVVGLLLVLACANIMNLLIARLISRRHELAIRTALGATRGRVVAQIVRESLVLGMVGGACGLALAWAGLQGIHAVAAEPIFRQIAIDWRVLIFAALLSFIAPLIFAVIPALRILAEDVRENLTEGSNRTIGGTLATRGRSALVVLQVSLAVTLLVVAALVVQSMRAVVLADPGYDTSPLLTARIDVPSWHLPDDATAFQRRRELVRRVGDLPGVRGVTSVSELPALQFSPQRTFDIDGYRAPEVRDRPLAGLQVVDAAFFDVFGIPITAGRAFEPADRSAARAVAVVSAEAARRYWPAPDAAVGSTIQLDDGEGGVMPATVIGVSRNLANPDLDKAPTPMIYVLDDHRPVRSAFLVVRAERPEQYASALRAEVAAVDPDLPVSELRTLPQAFADENSSNVLLGGMFASFAVIAILLAMGGLYGVMSYAVSQRAPEIAVRMALGASARTIAGQVVGQTVKLTALGLAIGLAGAYALASAISAALFGVTATDPATYAGAVVLTLTAALMAAWVPMRRAAAIDPVENLRRA